MKKIKKTFFPLLALLAISVLAITPVGAKTKPMAPGSSTTDMFGVEQVTFVRSNPFFRLVRVVDDIKSSFADDKLASRTLLLNQYAARLLKTYEVSPKNDKLTLEALRDYQLANYQYGLTLSHFNWSAAGDKLGLSAGIVTTFMSNLRLVDEMTGWSNLSNAHQAVLGDVKERMSSVAVAEIESVIGSEKFVSIATEGLSEKAPVEQLRTAEVFDLIAREAAFKGSNQVATTLLEQRAAILTRIAIQGGLALVSQIGSAAGSSGERLQTVLFLLNSPELAGNQQLIDLKNLLLIRAF